MQQGMLSSGHVTALQPHCRHAHWSPIARAGLQDGIVCPMQRRRSARGAHKTPWVVVGFSLGDTGHSLAADFLTGCVTSHNNRDHHTRAQAKVVVQLRKPAFLYRLDCKPWVSQALQEPDAGASGGSSQPVPYGWLETAQVP